VPGQIELDFSDEQAFPVFESIATYMDDPVAPVDPGGQNYMPTAPPERRHREVITADRDKAPDRPAVRTRVVYADSTAYQAEEAI
jgi:hypothetical protein